MKKTIFTILAVVISTFAFAQKVGNFEIGGHLGRPVGDMAPYSSVSLGINAGYTYPVSNNLDLGFAVGYSHFARKSTMKLVKSSFVPLALKGKYKIASSPIFVSLDLGGALYSKNIGFYAYPKVGYKIGKNELFLGYQHLSTKHNYYDYDINRGTATIAVNNANYASINIGYNYVFKF